MILFIFKYPVLARPGVLQSAILRLILFLGKAISLNATGLMKITGLTSGIKAMFQNLGAITTIN